MKIATVGLDLAKTLFQIHGVDSQGHVVVRKQVRRADVLAIFAKLEPCVVGMEACGSLHYWGRELTKLGHTVRLIAPQFVRPYVKSNKNERDAWIQAVQERRDHNFRYRIDASHSQGPVRSHGSRPQEGYRARRMECSPVRSIRYPSDRKRLNLLSYLHHVWTTPSCQAV